MIRPERRRLPVRRRRHRLRGGSSVQGDTDDIGQDEAALWPYAVPDIDGDGVDGTVLAGLGSGRGVRSCRALSRVGRIFICYVTFDCGPAVVLHPGIGPGTYVEGRSGAYCGTDGFVRWFTSEGRVVGTVWSLEADRLVIGGSAFDRADTGTDYPPDGMSELCGSLTMSPMSLLANYPEEPVPSPFDPEPPVADGDDIGIGTTCAAPSAGRPRHRRVATARLRGPATRHARGAARNATPSARNVDRRGRLTGTAWPTRGPRSRSWAARTRCAGRWTQPTRRRR